VPPSDARSSAFYLEGAIAQLVERFAGSEEVSTKIF